MATGASLVKYGGAEIFRNRDMQMLVDIDPVLCTGCKACPAMCPAKALNAAEGYCCAKCVKYCLSMDVPCKPCTSIVCEDLCDGCGLCIPACPEGATRRCVEASPVPTPSVG